MFELKNRGIHAIKYSPQSGYYRRTRGHINPGVRLLGKNANQFLAACIPGTEILVENKELLGEFVEGLYNYWRAFVRIMPL